MEVEDKAQTERNAEKFKEIAKNYYNKNFGTFSKSEIDLLMFKFFYEDLQSQNTDGIGTEKNTPLSDYRISKELGITERRVRDLRIRYYLKYGKEYDWKKDFVRLIQNARYDETSHKIFLNIPDPALYIEIQNYIEENGAYIEKQLNSKLLQMRAESFIDLVISAESTDNRDKIVKELKKQFKTYNKNEREFDEKNIAKSLMKSTCDIVSIAANISGMLSPGNIIGGALMTLLSNIKK